VNSVSASTIAAKTPPAGNFQPTSRNGRNYGCRWMIKANMSAGADVLEKDSVSVESVDDANGILLSFSTSLISFCFVISCSVLNER